MSLTQAVPREPFPLLNLFRFGGGAVFRQHLGQFGIGIKKHRRSRRAFGYLNLFRMRDIALGDACGLFEPLRGYSNWGDFLTSQFW